MGEGPAWVPAARWAGPSDIQGTWLSGHLDGSLESGELCVQRVAKAGHGGKREAAGGLGHAGGAHRRPWEEQ